MFDSEITAKTIIEGVQNEADIAPDIQTENYIRWLNAVEQLLYSEVIKEQKEVLFLDTQSDTIDLSKLAYGLSESPIRFEDIHAVYAVYAEDRATQLIKSTIASGTIFNDTYYKRQNDVGIKVTNQPVSIKIVYFVRPALKTKANYTTETVKLPVEFIDLVNAKLRGEAYKLANEGDLAAVWLNDYNVLLETFKAWVAEKQPTFGV